MRGERQLAEAGWHDHHWPHLWLNRSRKHQWAACALVFHYRRADRRRVQLLRPVPTSTSRWGRLLLTVGAGFSRLIDHAAATR